MRQLQLFNLSVKGVVLRFYLMMAVVAIAGFFSQFTLAAILGFTLAVSSILGVGVKKPQRKAVAKSVKFTTIKKEKKVAA